MRLKHLYLASILGLAISAAGLSGCADEMTVATPEVDNVEGIVLRIPNLDAAGQFSSTKATSDVTGAEGSIRDLWLVVFQKEGGDWKKLSCTDITDNGKAVSASYSQPYKDFKLDLLPGDYKFYLLANLKSYLPSLDYNTIEEETEITDLNLSFSGNIDSDNLPMVCLSKVKTSESGSAEEGSEINIEKEDAVNGKVIYADMKFLCSKVRYTVLFDKDDFSEGFSGDRTVDVGSEVGLTNIVNTTPVAAVLTAWDNLYVEDKKTADIEAKAFPAQIKNDDSSSLNLTGTSDDWTSSRRAWQGVAYLPENTNKSGKTSLELALNYINPLASNAVKNHTISLLPQESEGGIERGKMYDIIIRVKQYLGDPDPEPEQPDIELTLNISEWTTQSIVAEFTHSYLSVSKTKASVTSTTDDVISYTTEGTGQVTFTCNKNLTDSKGSKPVILATVNSDNTITFKANPDINVAELAAADAKGVAYCYVQSGNIKKELEISYDLTPFFTVTPLDVKIQWGTENTKQFAYSTNLGGIKLTGISNLSSYTIGYITLKCSDAGTSSGIITVTANSNPGTTVSYLFEAQPATQPLGTTLKENLTVTVMPPYGDYYIYFRAINDYQYWSTDKNDEEFLKLDGSYQSFPTEGGDNNWKDWWDNTAGDVRNNAWAHRIYVYTQNGEKIKADDIVPHWDFNVWNDESENPKDRITADNSNPGWYEYTLAQNASGSPKDGASGDKKPEPGKTLLIFYNSWNANEGGYAKHRAPHHNDAGIPLFDFEDREGWVLYDPTMEPYFRIYDDKPTIQDVTYTIYTTKPLTGWFKQYGIAGPNTSYDTNYPKFTIYSNNVNSTSYNSSYYVTKILLKAPADDHGKGINIKWGESSSENTLLFGGKTFSGDTGYFDGSNWHEGAPK